MMTDRFKWTRGLVAAALLASVTSAHALKFVPATGNDPATTTGASETVTYAKETLLKGTANVTAASDSADKTMYYNIVRDHFVAAPAGVTGSAADTYVVSYVLDGMVFQEQVAGSDLTASGGTATFNIASGGTAGDKEVVFRASTAVTDDDGDPALTLQLDATFAVSEDGGSITMMVRNADLEEILGAGRGSKTHGPARIAVKPALKVAALPMVPAPQAKAASEYMNFGGSPAAPVLRASLGTFEVGVVSPNLEDAQAADNTADDVDAFEAISATSTNTDGSLNNPVTFSVEGGFGFVKTLALADEPATGSTAGACDGTLTEIRKAVTPATNPATYTDETTPREAQTFDPDADATPARMLQNLCIEVDGETAIPATGPFMVMSTYKGIDNAAFPPMAMTDELASITHDGTTVHIPFISLHEKFNQRLILRNRSSQDVTYSITFDPEMDTTATAGMMASGTVPAGELMVILASDIVMLDGKSRTAATLTAPVAKGMLDVATSIVSRDTGSIDIETHMPQ